MLTNLLRWDGQNLQATEVYLASVGIGVDWDKFRSRTGIAQPCCPRRSFQFRNCWILEGSSVRSRQTDSTDELLGMDPHLDH